MISGFIEIRTFCDVFLLTSYPLSVNLKVVIKGITFYLP
jgi:hypothetical protein